MKSNIKTLSLLLLSFFSMTLAGFAQVGGPNQQDLANSFEFDLPTNFQQNQIDSLIAWQERIMVHVDKPVISENEPLFFKAYTLTGPSRVRATLSRVLKVELLNSNKDIVAAQYHKIAEGMVDGAFMIPKKLEDGNYTLRAYTRWLQNYGEDFYFSKELTLGEVKPKAINDETNTKATVSFYPEGSNLVGELNNRLLIKATDKNGSPIDLKGDIINQKGELVMPITAFGDGLMATIFTPMNDQSYLFRTTTGATYELPKITSDGYILHVNNLNSNTFSVRAQVRSTSDLGKVWAKGTIGGVTYFKKELDTKKTTNEFEISKDGIPSGVMMISLVDENDSIIANRPILVDDLNALNLSITPIEKTKNDDELVFKVKVTDKNGLPMATVFSMSATNIFENANPITTNDNTGFIWQSDGLENEAQNSDRTERFIQDLKLLTADELADKGQVPQRIKYPFQKGLDLFGYAYDLNNKLLKNSKIQMLNTSGKSAMAKELETDEEGKVRLENLDLVGENELVFRTSGEDTKSRLVKIVPIQEQYTNVTLSKRTFEVNGEKNKKLIKSSPWEPINQEDMVKLNEVEVMDKKLQKKNATPSLYGVVPTRVTYQDVERPKTIPQLFLGIPGVQVFGLGTLDPAISLPRSAGNGPLLWVLDGMPLIQPTPLNDIINMVSYIDVERIEILYGYQAAMYGTRASGGAILIYTRTAAGLDYINRKEGRLKFQGYTEPLSFESFAKKVAKKKKKFEDKTTTLFWNPKIQTDQNGEAIVRFSTPIEYSQLELKASAVSEKGEIGSTRIIL